MRGRIARRGKSWIVVVDVGKDPSTGRRRQHFESFHTQREAEHRLGDLLKGAQTGAYVKPTKQTTARYLQQWLLDYAAGAVRPLTLIRYQGIIENHLIPSLGAIPLADLLPVHVQACHAKALAAGLSPRSVIQHHRVLSEALKHAVRWGLAVRNVALAVDPPRAKRHEMRALDPEQVSRALAAADGTIWHPLFYLAIHSGLRRGEMLGLRWKDVDLLGATLSVVQVLYQMDDGRLFFGEPKTGSGRRSIDLTPASVLVLHAHRERGEAIRVTAGEAISPEDLVFSHPDGKPLIPSSATQAWRNLTRKTDLRGVRFHDLRHTHASLMLRAGVNPKVVSERLGHAGVAITLDTYSHVLPGLQREAAIKFQESLRAPSVESQMPA